MTDFFISYTAVDRGWAEWIAFVLEEQRYSVIIQAWDFRPGSNFALEMQRAASEAKRTIAVVSPDYLKSGFAGAEWSAAFAKDSEGIAGLLLPVIVRPCELTGLLKTIIHIDLSNSVESQAKSLLVGGVKRGRAKPSERPLFPGKSTQPPVPFPGRSGAADTESNHVDHIPELRRRPTDLEKRQFTKQAFDLTQARFRSALVELSRRNSLLSYEIENETNSKFAIEVFFLGNTIFGCRVWQGSLHSPDGISYAEGSRMPMGNAANEILTLSNDQKSIFFSALVGVNIDGATHDLDPKRLSGEGVAKYLWLKFARGLELHSRSRCEPLWLCRRPFCLSHAAIAVSFSMAK